MLTQEKILNSQYSFAELEMKSKDQFFQEQLNNKNYALKKKQKEEKRAENERLRKEKEEERKKREEDELAKILNLDN